MKFEIDDKTGMIKLVKPSFDYKSEDTFEFTNRLHLEKILVAVKISQSKLVNKQIQEIQDSEKPIRVQAHAITFIDSDLIERTMRLEKIEQNQKIVDALSHFVKEETKQSDYMTMKGDSISEECFREAQKEIKIAINTIKTIVERATGKDIKELS